MKKRTEIADQLLEQAANYNGVDRVLLLLESIYYVFDDVAYDEVKKLSYAYLSALQLKTASELEVQKKTLIKVYKALKYMQRFGYLTHDQSIMLGLESLMEQQGWEWKSEL